MAINHAKLGPFGCGRHVGFLNQEHNPVLVPFSDLDLIAGLPDEVRDIDDGQRVSTMNFENVAGRHRRERLARLERGYRTSETGKIKLDRGHALSLQQVSVAKEPNAVSRRDLNDVFPEFDKAVGLDE